MNSSHAVSGTSAQLWRAARLQESAPNAEVETVKHYFEYMLSADGQAALEESDYYGLPEGKKLGKVLKIAREAAAKIAY